MPLEIKRRFLPHWQIEGATYFVTWSLRPHLPEFKETEKDLIASAIRHFDKDRYTLFAYVVMNDHCHVLFSPNDSFPLSKILHSWKSFTANKLQRVFGRSGSIWLDESYDHIIRSDDEFVQKSEYIITNPRRRWPEINEYPWCWHYGQDGNLE